MIVQPSEIRDFFGDLDDSLYDTISSIHESAEEFVKTYCKRKFESTSYNLERYNGTGGSYLFLNEYPITAIDRIALGTIDVIKVKNTNANSNASVSVNSTGVRLVYNGTANSTVTFATYTTMSAVASAISAISGWSAEVLNSSYSSFKSTELLKKWGMNAIDSNYIYLSMPDDALDEFDVDEDAGVVIKTGGFPKSFKDVFVTYTAGYSSTLMPKDLKEAIKQLVRYLYNKREEETFGIKEYRIGYNAVLAVFEDGNFPKEVKQVINFYKKHRV